MRPQDLFGAAPKTVLDKPFFHAQDQKAYNVDGGTSIADAWTKHTLNTVIHNDIQGASLANDSVNLPAGTYYVDAEYIFSDTTPGTLSIPGIFVDGVKKLQGVPGKAADSARVRVFGKVILSIPGVLELRYQNGTSFATTGLGVSNNSGSITDASIPSIYADLQIWQLDRSLEIAPKAVNGPQTSIPGVQPASPISGLDITTNGQVITVTPGACLDSTETIEMAITTNKTWTVPGTNNLEVYLFLVRLVADGTFTVKGYSTLAGPSSDVLVDAWRFIHWNRNNGSGVLMPCVQLGRSLTWLSNDVPVISSTTTASFAAYSMASVVPVDICVDVSITSTDAGGLVLSLNGTHQLALVDVAITGDVMIVPALSNIYARHLSTSCTIKVRSITLRR